MRARAGTGWQTALADLSMILFMLTAAAVEQAPVEPAPRPALPAAAPMPALGEAVAQWRPGSGAPALGAWLRASAADPRLRATLLAAPEQAEQAEAMVRSAGRPVRMVFEPGYGGGVVVYLAYDREPGLAQGLQRN